MQELFKVSVVTVLVLGLYIQCNGQTQSPTPSPKPTPGPPVPSTTPASPFPGEHGMIMTTMHDYGAEGAAQLRHLEIYLGYENFSGSVPGISFSNPNIHFLSVDYDFRSNCIYMYDYHLRSIAIGCGYNTALNVSKMSFKFIHVGVSRGTVQIAVDWLTHTIYWSDSSFRWIVGAPAQPDLVDNDYYRIVQDTHLDAPDGLAVDPERQLLFWSDNGKHPKIERSTTSGMNRKTIVRKDLSSPLSMEVDIVEKRVYWIDASFETVVTSDYNGKDMYTIKRIPGSSLFDIALFQECVYVTDIRNSDLITLNKTNGPHKGKLESTTVNIYPETIYGIAVYGKEKQPPIQGKDYCAEKKCEHMCVFTVTGAKCLCSEGYHMNSTNQCEASYLDYQKALVVANETHICVVDIRAFAQTSYAMKCRYTSIKEKRNVGTTTPVPAGRKKRQAASTPAPSPSTPSNSSTQQPNVTMIPTTLPPPAPTAAPGDLIVKFDMDMENRNFFFATANNIIYKRPIDLPIENDAADPIAYATGNISGIAFDALNRENLFWSEYDTGHIRVVNIATKAVSRVDKIELKKPRELMVLLERRRLAMITGDAGQMSIQTMDFDGTNSMAVVSEVENIAAFEYDREERKFYYVSGTTMRSVKLDSTENKAAFYGIDSGIFHIVLYKNFLAWLFTSGSYKHLVRTHDFTVNRNNGLGFFNNSTLVDMKVLDIDLQTTGLTSPCAYENGNCSQLCITHYVNDNMQKLCECRIGYRLGPDKASCLSQPVNDHFILVADWTNEVLQQIDLQTNEIAAIPGNENDEYMGVFFDSDSMKVVWAEYYSSEIKSSFLNGTGLKILSDLGYDGYAYRFGKDMTTKNLYFTAYYDTFIGVLTNNGYYIRFDYDFNYDDLGDIVLHPGKGWMYFTVTGWLDSYIGRADMDGENVVKLISGDHVDYPDGLAIDYIHGHLYWSDATFDTIQQCDLDGKNCTTIINMTSTYRDEEIRDLETDGTYLYYSAYHKDHVVRVDLSTYERTVVGENPSLGKLDTISYYSSTNKNIQPVAAQCQDRVGLGDCSTVCFPTPKGRSCGCQKGISLKIDGRTCTDVYQCTDVIQQNITLVSNKTEMVSVTFDFSCLRHLDHRCQYKCPPNYVPIYNTPLVCTNVGWDKESRFTPLCREKRCSPFIKNGILANTCQREIGEKCDFTCKTGFKKRRKFAVCTKDESWHLPDEELCEPYICDDIIPNGKLDVNCDKKVGSTCQYTCNTFYTPSNKKAQAKCTANGWSPSASAMCKESICDATSLLNGAVSDTCTSNIGEACMYKCNQGFFNKTYMVVCKNDRKWHPSDSCQVSKCPTSIRNGAILQPCNFAIGSTCNVLCDTGFKRSSSYPNVTCGSTGQWVIKLKDTVCLNTATVVQKQSKVESDVSVPGVAVGVAVLVLIIIALVAVIIFLYRRNMGKSESTYATASFHNGATGIAIENPGYLQSNDQSGPPKEEHPYATADPSQMQPVTFAPGIDTSADDGISNPLYDKEPLPDVGHVEMDQDKTVLTYESWRKERENAIN